ncbi:hypothetical protein EMCRGX_G000537 [Ephydatia muelleri]
MGQCIGKEGTSRRGNYRKFEFTPKSSWRHKDSRMLSELVQSDHDDSAGDAPTTLVNENASDPGSDDEINTAGGVAQSSSRLVFAEDNPASRSKQHAAPGHSVGNGYSGVPQDEVLYTAPSNGDDDDDDIGGPRRRASNNSKSAHSSAAVS